MKDPQFKSTVRMGLYIMSCIVSQGQTSKNYIEKNSYPEALCLDVKADKVAE